jgi:hypothetical protein
MSLVSKSSSSDSLSPMPSPSVADASLDKQALALQAAAAPRERSSLPPGEAMSEPDHFLELPATLPSVKQPGHPCAGEGRCCGGCKNPKRPLHAKVPSSESSSTEPVAIALESSSATSQTAQTA